MAETTTGLTLGRYTLHGEIASGGMATVYLGRLSGPVGFSRPVAIKRMHPHIARDPEFVSMFVDEATLAARIQHPNVVPTLDVVAQDGEVFIVMEFVKGEALAALLRDEHRKRVQLELHIACSLMIGVLSGLYAAHCAKGDDGQPLHIVHRDVSPQNVLVGVDGLARIVDFGVAKAAVRSGVTRDHQIKGKICYMSPEQLCGHPVDQRADVFAAGAILWEMLAGRRLFSADDTGALVAAVIRAEVPPLSNYRDDVPPALEQALRCALAAGVDARFASAQHFADALEEAAPKIASQRAVGAWVAKRAAVGIAKQEALESNVGSRSASRSSAAAGLTPVSGVSGSVPRQSVPLPPPTSPRSGGGRSLAPAVDAQEQATELMPSPLLEESDGAPQAAPVSPKSPRLPAARTTPMAVVSPAPRPEARTAALPATPGPPPAVAAAPRPEARTAALPATPAPPLAAPPSPPAREFSPAPEEPAPATDSLFSDPAIPTPISSVSELGSGMIPNPTAAQRPSHVAPVPRLEIPAESRGGDGRQLLVAIGGSIAAVVVIGLAFVFLFSGDDLPAAPGSSGDVAADQAPGASDSAAPPPTESGDEAAEALEVDSLASAAGSAAASSSTAPTDSASATAESKPPVVPTTGPPPSQPKPRPTTYMPELP